MHAIKCSHSKIEVTSQGAILELEKANFSMQNF